MVNFRHATSIRSFVLNLNVWWCWRVVVPCFPRGIPIHQGRWSWRRGLGLGHSVVGAWSRSASSWGVCGVQNWCETSLSVGDHTVPPARAGTSGWSVRWLLSFLQNSGTNSSSVFPMVQDRLALGIHCRSCSIRRLFSVLWLAFVLGLSIESMSTY